MKENQIINKSEDRGKSPKTHVHDNVSAQMYSARFVKLNNSMRSLRNKFEHGNEFKKFIWRQFRYMLVIRYCIISHKLLIKKWKWLTIQE